MGKLKRKEAYSAFIAAGEHIDTCIDELVKLAGGTEEASNIKAALRHLLLYQAYLAHCLEELPAESEDPVILGFRQFDKVASIWEEDA